TVALKAYLAGFKVHKKGTAIIDGATAHWLIYSFALDDFKVKGKDFMLTKNEVGYVVTCSASPKTFGKYEGVFDRVAATFKVN
ncbi:MAG: hypothetical protein KAR06_06750, partial [Deltaproteobacteria bacterium]|nr:hypothetical protein [Deltaproteobacteria bacterium]